MKESDETRTKTAVLTTTFGAETTWECELRGKDQEGREVIAIRVADRTYILRRTSCVYLTLQSTLAAVQRIHNEHNAKRFVARLCPHLIRPLAVATTKVTQTPWVVEELLDHRPEALLPPPAFLSSRCPSGSSGSSGSGGSSAPSSTSKALLSCLRQILEACITLQRHEVVLLDITPSCIVYDNDRATYCLDPLPESMLTVHNPAKPLLASSVPQLVGLKTLRKPPELVQSAEPASQTSSQSVVLEKVGVYVFGLAFYELLLGSRAVDDRLRAGGPEEQDEFLKRVATRWTASVSTLSADANAKQDYDFALQTLLKCLQHEPAERASFAELQADFERLEQPSGGLSSYTATFAPLYAQLQTLCYGPELPPQPDPENLKLEVELQQAQEQCQDNEETIWAIHSRVQQLEQECAQKRKERQRLQEQQAAQTKHYKQKLATVRKQPGFWKPGTKQSRDRALVSNSKGQPSHSDVGKPLKERAEAVIALVESLLSRIAEEQHNVTLERLQDKQQEAQDTAETIASDIHDKITHVATHLNTHADTFRQSYQTLLADLNRRLSVFQKLDRAELYAEIASYDRCLESVLASWRAYMESAVQRSSNMRAEIMSVCEEASAAVQKATTARKQVPGTFEDFLAARSRKEKYIHYVKYGSAIELHLYNIRTKQTQVRVIASIIEHYGYDTAKVHNIIYIVGGQDKPVEGKTKNTLWTVNINKIATTPKELALTAKAKAEMLLPKYDLTIAKFAHNFLFSVGGRAMINNVKTYLNSCERYTIDLNRWTWMAPLNEHKCMASVCILSQRYLYAFGGYLFKDANVDLDTIERYDIFEGDAQWEVVLYREQRLWTQCSGAGCRQLNDGEIVLFGGDKNSSKLHIVCRFMVGPKVMRLSNSNMSAVADFHRRVVVQYQHLIYALSYKERHMFIHNPTTGQWIVKANDDWDIQC